MEKRVWKASGSFAKLFEEKFSSSEKIGITIHVLLVYFSFLPPTTLLLLLLL